MVLRDFTHAVTGKMQKFGFDPLFWAPIIFILLSLAVSIFDPDLLLRSLAALITLFPLWFPFILLYTAWIMWVRHIRWKFWVQQEFVLLEIRLPRQVNKSPLAMEVVLMGIHNAGGETTWLDRAWKGKFRAVWSFEIASNEGRISYYLHTRKILKNIIEARIYGQFPDAEVVEVPDYAAATPFNLKDYDLFGCEYKFGKPDPYPLKTYVDYGLDKDPKEELKVDPITNILEFMGQIGQGEHIWFQIIARARKKDEWFTFYKKTDELKANMEKEIEDIYARAAKRAARVMKDIEFDEGGRLSGVLTDGEKRAIIAMERNFAKFQFECGFRVVYVAKKGYMHGINNGGVIRFFDPFRSNEFNSLGATRYMADLDWPWQDFMNIRRNKFQRELYHLYTQRAYFYVPHHQVHVTLSTEELATIWHFPSEIVQTPALQRVASRRATAPGNLPV